MTVMDYRMLDAVGLFFDLLWARRDAEPGKPEAPTTWSVAEAEAGLYYITRTTGPSSTTVGRIELQDEDPERWAIVLEEDARYTRGHMTVDFRAEWENLQRENMTRTVFQIMEDRDSPWRDNDSRVRNRLINQLWSERTEFPRDSWARRLTLIDEATGGTFGPLGGLSSAFAGKIAGLGSVSRGEYEEAVDKAYDHIISARREDDLSFGEAVAEAAAKQGAVFGDEPWEKDEDKPTGQPTLAELAG